MTYLNHESPTREIINRMSPDMQRNFHAGVEALEARYGSGESSHTRQLTAIHEAGHALALHISGYKSTSKIWKDKQYDLWLGRTFTPGGAEERFENNPDGALGYGVFCFAGLAAELVVGKSLDFGSSKDEQVLAMGQWAGFANLLGKDPDYYSRLGRMASMALAFAYSDEIKSIARRLVACKKINTRETARRLQHVPQGDGYAHLWHTSIDLLGSAD